MCWFAVQGREEFVDDIRLPFSLGEKRKLGAVRTARVGFHRENCHSDTSTDDSQNPLGVRGQNTFPV